MLRASDAFQKENSSQVQYLEDLFWKRWSKEYLPLLQSRQKWTMIRKNLTIGDIILVSMENSPCNSWP